MEEMRVYIANLGKYNEGELVGAWFTLPVDEDEMAERIGLNDLYEEYAIHDYELPFEIDEYTPIEEVNRLCEMVEEMPDYIVDNLKEIVSYFSGIEDVYDHMDDICLLSGCDDMTDVAYYYVEECGYLDGAPDIFNRYFDYAAFGRDLAIEGSYIESPSGMIEIRV